MNQFQATLAAKYAGGEFSYVTSNTQAARVGDTLFYFLWLELEDVTEVEEAHKRVETAIQDLEAIRWEFRS